MNSADGITWTNTTITGITATPLGVTWGGDRIVATFNGGSAISTNNGISWTALVSVSPGIVCWDGTKLLAALSVGTTYGLSTSVDGLAWAGTAIEPTTAATGPGASDFNYINSTYLSVTSSLPFTSADNISWTRGRLLSAPGGAVTYFFGCIGGSASYYVAGGSVLNSVGVQSTLLYTSTDAANWTLRAAGIGTNAVNAVASNGTVTVITGETGSRRYSTDGVTWSATTGAATSSSITLCIWANNQFVAMGSNYVAVSADGITWTAGTISQTNLYSIVWDPTHSVYIVGSSVGGIYISSNGTTWSSVTISGMSTVSTLVTNGSRVVALSGVNRVAAYSDNGGTSWTTYTLPTEGSITAAVYDGTQFIATGNNGVEITSLDGITWANTQRFLIYDIANVFVVSQDNYLAVQGNGAYPGRVFSTTNAGRTWVWNYISGAPNIYDIHYNGTQYVAVGGINAGTVGKIYTSTDLITWTVITTASPYNFKSVAYSGSMYVAAANNGTALQLPNGAGGSLWSSNDGATWTQRSTAHAFNKVKWLGGQFIAAASSGTTAGYIYTSPDGINWTLQYSIANAPMTDIAYSGSTYVASATGTTNKLFTSPDGVTWTPRMTSALAQMVAVEYGNGVFMAIEYSSGPGSQVSSDGVTWTSAGINTSVFYSSLDWDTDRFVAFTKTHAALVTYIPQ
jgi:hypothetical protein